MSRGMCTVVFGIGIAGALASGCTQPLHPVSLEPVPLKVVPGFGGGTLEVRVSEEARGRESTRAESGVRYEVDLPEWNEFFAGDVAEELERRGVTVRNGHERYVALYIYDIRSDLDGVLFKADVHLNVVDQDKKTMIDQVFRASHPQMGAALGMALYNAKLALLEHGELRALIK